MQKKQITSSDRGSEKLFFNKPKNYDVVEIRVSQGGKLPLQRYEVIYLSL